MLEYIWVSGMTTAQYKCYSARISVLEVASKTEYM